MSYFNELEEKYKSKGLFNSGDNPISYPIGFPILDQNLGGIYRRQLPDGTIYEYKKLGIPAGTITQFGGSSSTGKTTAGIQASWNIVEPFDDDAVVFHFDEELATTYERVVSVTGATYERVRAKYRIYQDVCTWEGIQKMLLVHIEERKANPKRFMYKTGVLDINGNEIIYYKPTVVLIDSLMKVTSANEDIDTISGLTSAGRETIYRNKFLRNMLTYMGKFNINIIFINHTANDMNMGKPGGGSKQLTFIETGKMLPGGDKSIAWTTSIIIFKTDNNKDNIKSEENEGYNGLTSKAMVTKSRSSKGGTIAHLEFSQEYGFDPKLTLMNFAKEKGIISGRNPSCYFACNPDIKFDTRIFISEMKRDPRILQMLAQQCKPELEKLLHVFDLTDDNGDDPISSGKVRREFRDILRDMYK